MEVEVVTDLVDQLDLMLFADANSISSKDFGATERYFMGCGDDDDDDGDDDDGGGGGDGGGGDDDDDDDEC